MEEIEPTLLHGSEFECRENPRGLALVAISGNQVSDAWMETKDIGN